MTIRQDLQTQIIDMGFGCCSHVQAMCDAGMSIDVRVLPYEGGTILTPDAMSVAVCGAKARSRLTNTRCRRYDT